MDNYMDEYIKSEKALELKELKEKIKLLCSILLRKDPQYEAWIEKNIGKEYL